MCPRFLAHTHVVAVQVATEGDHARKTASAETPREPEKRESTESFSMWGRKRTRTASVRKRAEAPWQDAVAALHAARPRSGAHPAAEFPPMNPDAKLQAFLTGTGLQLPGQPPALPAQPQMDPFAWQLQYAQQMHAAQMHAAAQAAQFQGMYASLFQGATGQAQAVQAPAPWGNGTVPWAAPAGLPWGPAQVAAAAQAAAAANPSATATLAQQAAAWAAAQVSASLPSAATGIPVASVPGANPALLPNPMQSLCSNASGSAAVQPTAAVPSSQLWSPPVSAAADPPSCAGAHAPSVPQHGLEPTAAPAPAALPECAAVHEASTRATLHDIADAAAAAAAAAAADFRQSLSAADAEPAGAPHTPDRGAAETATLPSAAATPAAAPSAACTSAVEPGHTPSGPSAAHLQTPCSTAAAPDGAPAEAAGNVAPAAAVAAAPPQAEGESPAGGAIIRSEVIQVGHKRARMHRLGGSCTEEDSSDEATIAIKHTGSDIHRILPGVSVLLYAVTLHLVRPLCLTGGHGEIVLQSCSVLGVRTSRIVGVQDRARETRHILRLPKKNGIRRTACITRLRRAPQHE